MEIPAFRTWFSKFTDLRWRENRTARQLCSTSFLFGASDHFWVFSMLWFLSLHIHHSSTPYNLRCLSFIYAYVQIPAHSDSPDKKGRYYKGRHFGAGFISLMQLDTSKIYHGIRGQSAIKLYVMFNVLEIADKLCSALGQDILDCLFSGKTLNISSRPRVLMLKRQ